MDKRTAKHLACRIVVTLIDSHLESVAGPEAGLLRASLEELRNELQARADMWAPFG